MLLPAAIWHYPMELMTTDSQSLHPPLHALVASLIDTWLDAETLSQTVQLRTYLSYVKTYVAVTLEPSFLTELNQQYHRDFWAVYQISDIRPRERDQWRAKRARCTEGDIAAHI